MSTVDIDKELVLLVQNTPAEFHDRRKQIEEEKKDDKENKRTKEERFYGTE